MTPLEASLQHIYDEIEKCLMIVNDMNRIGKTFKELSKLSYVPEKLLSEILKRNNSCYYNITEILPIEIIKNSCDTIELQKEIAKKRNGFITLMNCFDNIDYEVLKLAVETHPDTILLIQDKYNFGELYKIALEKRPKLILDLKKITKELALFVINKIKNDCDEIIDKILDKLSWEDKIECVKVAIIHCPEIMQKVNENLLTIDMCKDAIIKYDYPRGCNVAESYPLKFLPNKFDLFEIEELRIIAINANEGNILHIKQSELTPVYSILVLKKLPEFHNCYNNYIRTFLDHIFKNSSNISHDVVNIAVEKYPNIILEYIPIGFLTLNIFQKCFSSNLNQFLSLRTDGETAFHNSLITYKVNISFFVDILSNLPDYSFDAHSKYTHAKYHYFVNKIPVKFLKHTTLIDLLVKKLPLEFSSCLGREFKDKDVDSIDIRSKLIEQNFLLHDAVPKEMQTKELCELAFKMYKSHESEYGYNKDEIYNRLIHSIKISVV